MNVLSRLPFGLWNAFWSAKYLEDMLSYSYILLDGSWSDRYKVIHHLFNASQKLEATCWFATLNFPESQAYHLCMSAGSFLNHQCIQGLEGEFRCQDLYGSLSCRHQTHLWWSWHRSRQVVWLGEEWLVTWRRHSESFVFKCLEVNATK